MSGRRPDGTEWLLGSYNIIGSRRMRSKVVLSLGRILLDGSFPAGPLSAAAPPEGIRVEAIHTQVAWEGGDDTGWGVVVRDLRVDGARCLVGAGTVPLAILRYVDRLPVVRRNIVLAVELRWHDPVTDWVSWRHPVRRLRRWWRLRHPVTPPPAPTARVQAMATGVVDP